MNSHFLTSAVTAAIADLLGSQPSSWKPAQRGFTTAHSGIVSLKNGATAFIKLATDEQTAEWLAVEKIMYEEVHQPFMPRFLGYGMAGKWPFLALEDLSSAHWPPPWSEQNIAKVFAMLEVLHRTPPPAALPTLEELRPMRGRWGGIGGWPEVQKNPEPFLALKLCSPQWLKEALPYLVKAETEAVLGGDDLVHLDIRSDNVCFKEDQVLVVDWNLACRGNGTLDVIGWLPSLYLEGGPAPWEVNMKEAGLISLMCGYFASRSPLAPPRPGSRIREFQYQQLLVTLPWVCRVLHIPLPEPLKS